MLMRSTVFPFLCNLKIDFEKFSIYLFKFELLSARHTVSILLVLIVEPLSVLSVRNENQSLVVVLSFSIFVFNFFYKAYKEFLVYFIVRLIWQ